MRTDFIEELLPGLAEKWANHQIAPHDLKQALLFFDQSGETWQLAINGAWYRLGSSADNKPEKALPPEELTPQNPELLSRLAEVSLSEPVPEAAESREPESTFAPPQRPTPVALPAAPTMLPDPAIAKVEAEAEGITIDEGDSGGEPEPATPGLAGETMPARTGPAQAVSGEQVEPDGGRPDYAATAGANSLYDTSPGPTARPKAREGTKKPRALIWIGAIVVLGLALIMCYAGGNWAASRLAGHKRPTAAPTSPAIVPTSDATAVSKETEAADPSPAPLAGPSAAASPTVTATPSPESSLTPTCTASPLPTAIPPATDTPRPTPSNTPTLTPSPTVTRTPTPAPTPTAVSADDGIAGWIVFPLFDAKDVMMNIMAARVSGDDRQMLVSAASQPGMDRARSRFTYRSWEENHRGIFIRDVVAGTPFGLAEGEWRVTDHFEAARLALSWDGLQVVYPSRQESDRKWRIYGVNGDRLRYPGGDLTGTAPAWMGDNAFILNHCENNACGLYAIRLNGTNLRQLSSRGDDTNPAVSPDGKLVAFSSVRSGNSDLYILDPATGQAWQLTRNDAEDGLPTWSPDGRWIAFLSNRGGKWAVWAIAADGAKERKLFSLGGEPAGCPPRVTPGECGGWQEERLVWVP